MNIYHSLRRSSPPPTLVVALSVLFGCDTAPQTSGPTGPVESTTTASNDAGEEGDTGHSSAGDDTADGQGATSSVSDASTGAGADGGDADPAGSTTGSDSSGDSGQSSDDGAPPIEQEGHLFWHVNAETGSPQPSDEAHDGITKYLCLMHSDETMSFDELPGGYGDYAIRTKVVEGWPWGNANSCHHKVRSYFLNRETVHLSPGEPVWMGWAIYVPEDWHTGNGGIGAVNYHGPPGTPPQLTISAGGSHWTVSSRSDVPGEQWPLQPGTWNEFVVHAAFANNNNGFAQVWHKLRDSTEWTQHVDFEGKTVENGSEFPFHTRIGLIGPKNWSDSADIRVLYFDEIRLGDEMSNFEEVAPGSGYQLPGFDD